MIQSLQCCNSYHLEQYLKIKLIFCYILCSLSLTINEPNYKLQTTNKPQGRNKTVFTLNTCSAQQGIIEKQSKESSHRSAKLSVSVCL